MVAKSRTAVSLSPLTSRLLGMRSEWTQQGAAVQGGAASASFQAAMAVSASMGSSVRRRSSIAARACGSAVASRDAAVGAGAVVEVGLPQGGDELRQVASQELGFAEAAFGWSFAVDPPVHCPRPRVALGGTTCCDHGRDRDGQGGREPREPLRFPVRGPWRLWP